MKFSVISLFILVSSINSVLAKGGGGGGRGGRGGGGIGRGGGGGGGGSRPGWGGGSRPGRGGGWSPGWGRSPSRVIGSPNKISKGGSGSFNSNNPPPYSYTNTRSTYTNYHPAYSGGYTPASRYGYTGFYNPGFTYWAITPPFFFLGYHSAYHRYHPITGYYYAPQITYQGTDSDNVVINGTANSGDDKDNFRYSFNISTNNQYPMADHAFYSSSDPNANVADFAYRLEFTHIIEFEDANQNGFYDDDEKIISVTSLRGLQWQPLSVENITVPTNQSQFYIEAKTSTSVVYNNTENNPSFDVHITWRSSNLQLNNTAPIIMQPNSLQYDVSIANYPSNSIGQPKNQLAIAQLLSTLPDEIIILDVNTTTPVDVANQVKTNVTYGISIGNYTQGRLEYQPSVNITNVGIVKSWIDLDPTAIANSSYYSNYDWIWGSIAPSARKSDLLFVTIPKSSMNTTSTTYSASISGFAFLDTDVMGAMVDDPDSNAFFYFQVIVIVGMLITLYVLDKKQKSDGYTPIP